MRNVKTGLPGSGRTVIPLVSRAILQAPVVVTAPKRMGLPVGLSRASRGASDSSGAAGVQVLGRHVADVDRIA